MAKKRHYSTRLGRPFQDGDELTREEASQVLAENSGRSVEPKYVFDLIRLGVVEPHRLSPRKLLYLYSAIKNYVVASHVGRREHAKPTDNALRQRRFRDRRRTGDQAQKKGD